MKQREALSLKDDEILLRMEDLTRHVGKVSRATVYRWIKHNSFPPPIQLGPNVSAWVQSEIQAWKRSKIAERDSKAT